MPAPAKGVGHVWQADGDTDAAVAGDDFEEDVEDRVVDWIAVELGGFCYGDEEDGEDDPPEVVGQLAAELLADKVAARFGSRSRRIVSHGSFEAVEKTEAVVGVGGILF